VPELTQQMFDAKKLEGTEMHTAVDDAALHGNMGVRAAQMKSLVVAGMMALMI